VQPYHTQDARAPAKIGSARNAVTAEIRVSRAIRFTSCSRPPGKLCRLPLGRQAGAAGLGHEHIGRHPAFDDLAPDPEGQGHFAPTAHHPGQPPGIGAARKEERRKAILATPMKSIQNLDQPGHPRSLPMVTKFPGR